MKLSKLRKNWVAWNRRLMVKNASNTVKHWKFEANWPFGCSVVGLIFSLVSLLFWSTRTIGSIGVHVVFIIMFCWFFYLGMKPNKYPRCLARMTPKERVYRCAKFYSVTPNEVFARLKKEEDRDLERINKDFTQQHKKGLSVFDRIRAWNYRQRVKNAAGDVKHWCFGFGFYTLVSVLFAVITLNALFQAKFIGVIVWGVFSGGIFVLAWKKWWAFKNKTEKARILLAAKRNGVKPEDVAAWLRRGK